ncbi:MAG: DUF2868 domain-containing protein [Gammaproteobacteria bacterium]|nr:DUF2868 domain-containing protein [Gammaproteobacteria bacterium]
MSESEGAAGQYEALERLPETHRVVVLTKGWEPPLLSFVDFLERLRERLGEGALIVVVPLDAAGNDVDAKGREVWATALARSEDARLYVAEAGQ